MRNVNWTCDKCKASTKGSGSAPDRLPDGWSRMESHVQGPSLRTTSWDLCRACTIQIQSLVDPFAGLP